jgi:hypothetical protein
MGSPRWIVLLPAFVLATTLSAQPRPPADPTSAFQLRFGGFFPAGDGDFWKENEDVFTLDSGAFNDFILGLTFVAPVSNQVGVGFNLDFYDAESSSSYRDWTDGLGFPISHDTRLGIVPMIVDMRFYPGGRSGARGPRPAFYLGGGVGANYWVYEEEGDFLDFTWDPPEIFYDDFRDDGFAFAAQALAGVELPLGPRWNALFEARYTWSEAELGGDFTGLGTLDLSGLAVYAGFGVRF